MKTFKRFLLGVLSSAFLAVGLARVADRLDPVTRNLPAVDAAITHSAPDTDAECHFS